MERGMLRNNCIPCIVMMDDIKGNINVWLTDCLLSTKTEDDLLATLNFFFKQCQKHRLKLFASKCVFFATTVRYCGRLITKDEVRFDPKNMEVQAMRDRRTLPSWCNMSLQ
jgi:hypothetical protein